MATLKISDLSVGDWVGFEMANLSIEGDDIATAFVEKINKPARIKSISGDQDLILAEVDNVDNFGTIYLKIEHILPIPITAEILEKNGWKLSKSNWFEFEDGEWKINIWIGKSKCNIEISRKREIYMSTYADIQVVKSNINTLQHALRLAGVDKKINL